MTPDDEPHPAENAERVSEPVSASDSDAPGGEDEAFFAPSPEMDVTEPSGPPAESTTSALPEPPGPVRPRPSHPASAEAVRLAIDEVMAVLSSLRESVDKMDEVLEILEEAERQKTADEREIDALRQQLRRFHRPSEEIPRPARPAPAPASTHGSHRDNPRHRDSREQRAPHRGQREAGRERGRERNREHHDSRGQGTHDARRPSSSPPPPASAGSSSESASTATEPFLSESPPVPPSSASTHGFDSGDPS